MNRKLIAGAFLVALGLSVGCSKKNKVTDPVSNSTIPVVTTTDVGVQAPSVAGFVPQTVYFGYDRASLSADSQSSLDSLANFMRGASGANLEVEGHCDERGSTEYNIALGMRRAQAVTDYLINSGVNPSQINPVSYGEERPSQVGHDEGSWSANRRAEFVLMTQ
jgi:peptidoglycan-associated lipoprotein